MGGFGEALPVDGGMLERGKRQGGALRVRLRTISATLACLIATTPASAQTMFEQMAQGVAGLRQHEFVTLAILVGILVFAATTAVILVRTR